MSKPSRKELAADIDRLKREVGLATADALRWQAKAERLERELDARPEPLAVQARRWVADRVDDLVDLAGFGGIGGR